MGFFKSWIKRRKEKKLENKFEQIGDSVLLEEDRKNGKKIEHFVIERIEQIVEATKEIEEEKPEYRVVTAYLNDIYTIGNLSEKEREVITDVAQNIVNLDRARQEFLHAEKKITDVQFTTIQQEEATVPNTIKRLKENEEYQEILNKDMKYLVRERDEWLFYKEELLAEEKRLQNGVRLTVGIGIATAILMAAYQVATESKMELLWTIFLFVMAILICILTLKIMNVQKDYRRATKNADRAIQLLNMVKLKYVNITNAIDYCREKFHVENAGEFNRLWEAYLEAVKQREKFNINNDDLRYYSNRLIRMLAEYNLYDVKVWIPQALALADHKEMVEVTHRLNERRQKIRGRIEKSMEIVKGHAVEVEALMRDLSPETAMRVEEIMRVVEKLGVSISRTNM